MSKITLVSKVTVTVDVDAWANEYGLPVDQVPADARAHVDTTAYEMCDRLDAAEKALAGLVEPQVCEVVYEPPFDFRSCRTHDRTFPLDGACDHAEMSEVDWLGEREQQQRARAITAEERAAAAEAEVARLRETVGLLHGWEAKARASEAARQEFMGAVDAAMERFAAGGSQSEMIDALADLLEAGGCKLTVPVPPRGSHTDGDVREGAGDATSAV